MLLKVIDGALPDDQCEAIVARIRSLVAPLLSSWEVGAGHIHVPTVFPELVELYADRLGLRRPSAQMCLYDPPGSRGVRPHGHDTDAVLFYPAAHAVALDLAPPDSIEVLAGRIVLMPHGVKHSVKANDTGVERFCIPTLYN